ncbi:RpiB/LacA/LacB family sugar-phosphate isomerase [Streptomyces sp. NPDC047453]|uniref:RpiB/LacA/LacB family sugar-phosphate isomerase n=1 Tax=Streptomyces sp. NPDC047453 TaxID=3154812 RepID=UPI0033CA4852
MRVYLGSDHAGYELRNHLVAWLTAAGHEPVDCGPHISPFSEEERHIRRIDMLSDYERTGMLPEIPAHHPQQD